MDKVDLQVAGTVLRAGRHRAGPVAKQGRAKPELWTTDPSPMEGAIEAGSVTGHRQARLPIGAGDDNIISASPHRCQT